MNPSPASDTTNVCAQCGTTLPEATLLCPGCHALKYAPELEHLASQAAFAANRGDPAAARNVWLQALPMLPPESVQYQTVQQRIAELETQVPPPKEPAPTGAI